MAHIIITWGKTRKNPNKNHLQYKIWKKTSFEYICVYFYTSYIQSQIVCHTE